MNPAPGGHPTPHTDEFEVHVRLLESTRMLDRPSAHRVVLRSIGGLALLAIVVMFLPWQQNVQGKGHVSALRPGDRPQVVNAVVGGRVEEWLVAEGQFVAAGTPLLRLSEVKDVYLDPRVEQRYREQVTAKREAIGSKRDKAEALTQQAAALNAGLRVSLDKGRNKVRQYEAALTAAVIDSGVAAAQLQRQETLFREGLKALSELEAARLRAQRANASLAATRAELGNATLELDGLSAEYADKIAKSSAERSATLADMAEGSADVAKLQNLEASVAARRELRVVRAPRDGYVVRALKAGIGEIVKDGEAIVTIQPTAPSVAVELFVRAVDVPLLSPGRRVRLQFDGWPALQFSGWPSVSVGTFGGRIAVVDLINSPDGRYRVLVVPDSSDEPWPRQLRVGSGVYGWAMLNEVRVGFELWRQVNGFPPSVAQPVDGPVDGKK